MSFSTSAEHMLPVTGEDFKKKNFGDEKKLTKIDEIMERNFANGSAIMDIESNYRSNQLFENIRVPGSNSLTKVKVYPGNQFKKNHFVFLTLFK